MQKMIKFYSNEYQMNNFFLMNNISRYKNELNLSYVIDI